MTRGALIGVGLTILLVSTVTAQAPGDSLPIGVTPAMVTRGGALFQGKGLCLACHGPDGSGGLGPDLTDTVWVHNDGSYDALVRRITAGVPLKASQSGSIMPPRGGAPLTDEEVRAVAAYVWTLSHRARHRAPS